VDDLNARFDSQLLREKPNTALSWYLNREEDHLQADGSLSPRILWHNDLILPPKVEPVLRELCSSFSWGHLHPDCPPDKVGQFRLVRSSHLASRRRWRGGRRPAARCWLPLMQSPPAH
jgi:hypothetical protein